MRAFLSCDIFAGRGVCAHAEHSNVRQGLSASTRKRNMSSKYNYIIDAETGSEGDSDSSSLGIYLEQCPYCGCRGDCEEDVPVRNDTVHGLPTGASTNNGNAAPAGLPNLKREGRVTSGQYQGLGGRLGTGPPRTRQSMAESTDVQSEGGNEGAGALDVGTRASTGPAKRPRRSGSKDCSRQTSS